MLKYENVAEVGDVIMALDFKPSPEMPTSYLTGRVIAKGDMGVCNGYKVKVINSETGCNDFDAKRIGTEMVVPFEMMMLEFEGRVTPLLN